MAVRAGVLIAGAVLMALEIVAFRIIGRSFGTALRETTTVIAVFMLVMSVGYFAGGRIGDRWPRAESLCAVLMAAGLTTLIVPQLDATLTDRIAATRWPAMHAFAATSVLFAIPTFLLSAVSPIAVRLFAVSTAHSGSVAGSISALSTIGSVGGSVLTAFVLVDALGSMNLTALLLGSVALALAAAISLVTPSRTLRIATVAVAIVAGLGVSLSASRHRAVPEAAGARVIFERDSQYHSVRVVERRGGVRDLWIDWTLNSRLYINDPNLRALLYEEYKHVAKLARPELRRVLAIGLGGGTSVRQFTTFYPDVSVEAVEIDPLIVTTAERFFGVQQSDRLRIHVADGRAYLRSAAGPYDLVTIDAYTRGRYGSTIPPHLVTREFFTEVASKLSEEGIVHFHSYAGRDTRFSRAMYKTLASVFPSVVILGDTELLASRTPIDTYKAGLKERAAAIRARIPEIDERIETLTATAPEVGDVPLLTDDFAPVDALLRGLRQ